MTLSQRICLITPGHLSTNPRVVKEAQALTEEGCSVNIVLGRYITWAIEEDRRLADASWRLIPVAFGRRTTPMITHLRQRGQQAAARRLSRVGVNTPRLSGQAFSSVTSDLAGAARAVEPCTLYIAHYLPGLVAAAQAARRHGARYAFDAEDFHLGDLPDVSEHRREKDWIRRIEAAYLPGAAYVTAASPMIARAYAEAYGIPSPTTVLNVFPRASAPPAPTPKGAAAPGPSLYWFSQTIGPGRGLETAVEAVARASCRPHLYLRGTAASGYEIALRGLAASLGVADRLHFLPPASPLEVERLGVAYDLGFVGEQPLTRNRRIALTNKLFSYWTSGLPTLVSDIPAHRPFVAEYPDFVRGFTDAASLASGLDEFLSDAGRLAKARAAAYDVARETYNWDRERRVFLDVVARALDAVPGREDAAVPEDRPAKRSDAAAGAPGTSPRRSPRITDESGGRGARD